MPPTKFRAVTVTFTVQKTTKLACEPIPLEGFLSISDSADVLGFYLVNSTTMQGIEVGLNSKPALSCDSIYHLYLQLKPGFRWINPRGAEQDGLNALLLGWLSTTKGGFPLHFTFGPEIYVEIAPLSK